MVETGLANAIVTGVVTGSIVALGAIGLSLVYSIAEVPNFAHGELLMLGAYLALFVNKPSTVPFFEELATGPQALSTAGFVVLFLLAVGGALGAVYVLGGAPALKGSWWPVDPPPAVAVAVHVLVAAALGGLVLAGFPSLPAGVLFSVLLLAALSPLQDKYVFQQFRSRGADLATLLIVALGLDFVLRFGTQAVYSGQVRRFEVPSSFDAFGTAINVANARFFDFYLHDGGLFIEVLDSGQAGTPQLVTAGYGLAELAVVVLGTVAVGAGAYRLRRRQLGANVGTTFGPRLAAAVAGIATLLVTAFVFIGGGTRPDAPLATTRISLSFIRGSTVLIAVGMMATLHVLLRETKLGKAMRAASDNKDLAQVTGINTDRVMMATWIIAGVFAAVGGVMLGVLFSVISINMGFFLLLPMFAGVILGGIDSVYGAIIGSIVVGIAMDVGIFAFDVGTTYRVPMAFVVLFIVLLVKPEGIVGGR